MLLDSLKDIIKHTYNLGFLEMVKIIGTSTDAKLEALDADRSVILLADMYQPINGIESTIGLSRMAVLKGFVDFPLFSSDTASVDIITENRNGVDVPCEIKFNSGSGHISNYRFMSETMINEQVKIPPFKGATWNITISPEKKRISELSYFLGVLGGFEKRFIVSVDKGVLNFNVGNGPTDKTVVPFADNVSGTLKSQWSWPLSQVLSILKLSDTASTTTMKFSDVGALMIEVDSGIGRYQYILPAGKA